MRPIADLEEELNEVAGHLNAQHARLAVLARELLDQPSAWASDGIWTLERYLCWRRGVSSGHARQLADIARRADELPECMAAFERGELSLDQATVLARKVPSWADAVAHHHRLHHQRRLGIAGNADVPGGIVFTDGNGKQILASGARPRPPGGTSITASRTVSTPTW